MLTDVMRPMVASKTNLHRLEGNNLKASYKNMSSWRILWSTGTFLGYRHRVGLLISAIVLVVSLDHIGGLTNLVLILQGIFSH